MKTAEAGGHADRARSRRTGSVGAGRVPFARAYDVQVVYTEPEFQRRTPGAPAEYSFTYFGIVARSPEEAVQSALQDFRDVASRSWVSWRRCVKRVAVLDGSPIAPECQENDLPAEF